MSTLGRLNEQWVVRAGIAGLFVVLSCLAGLALVTDRATTAGSQRADAASRLSATYQDARHSVVELKSIERAYRVEGSSIVRDAHAGAERRLVVSLRRVARLDGSARSRRTVARLLALQREYHVASRGLFA